MLYNLCLNFSTKTVTNGSSNFTLKKKIRKINHISFTFAFQLNTCIYLLIVNGNFIDKDNYFCVFEEKKRERNQRKSKSRLNGKDSKP